MEIFIENILLLENVEEILYLMKLNIVKELKILFFVAIKTKNTFVAERILNQKSLKKLQKFLLVILKKLQLLLMNLLI